MPPSTAASTEVSENEALGRFITVFRAGSDTGEAYVCIDRRGDRLAIEPVLPGRPLPNAGERVRCLSRVGQWDSVTSTDPDGAVALTIPAWVARATARRSVRVHVGAATTLLAGDERWPARVTDLSVTGSAIVVETAAAIEVGRELICLLPRGRAGARVMSVRPHEHPLLEVLGVMWRTTDTDARTWISETVTRSRTALQP